MSRLLLSAVLSAALAPLALASGEILQPLASKKAYGVEYEKLGPDALRCPCEGYAISKDGVRLGVVKVPEIAGYTHRQADLEEGILILLAQHKVDAPASTAKVNLSKPAQKKASVEGSTLTVGDRKLELDPKGRAAGLSVSTRGASLIAKAAGADGKPYYTLTLVDRGGEPVVEYLLR